MGFSRLFPCSQDLEKLALQATVAPRSQVSAAAAAAAATLAALASCSGCSGRSGAGTHFVPPQGSYLVVVQQFLGMLLLLLLLFLLLLLLPAAAGCWLFARIWLPKSTRFW